MKNILIADDHSLIRSGLRMMLGQMAIKTDISEAWDAKTVMTRLKEKAFDLVLLDIQMPATDSVVLMHWIQSFYPDTKILIVSQNPENTYGKRYAFCNAFGILSGDEDTDARLETAGNDSPKRLYTGNGLVTPKQAGFIKSLLKKKGYTEKDLSIKYEVTSISQLASSQASQIIENLQKLPDMSDADRESEEIATAAAEALS